jgi:energy-coupling factor transporter ATP-binding protein EcfA2
MSIAGGHRRITHEGLKVGPVTLLTGANGRGKSTRLGIPELVLTPTVQGAYPVLGATDYDWSATLRFDDATMVARFVRAGKPGVAINGIPVGVKEAAKRLPEAVGASATLSIGAFLALPARERMTWLQEHVLHGAGWSVDEARQRLDVVATDYPAVAEDLRAATGIDGRELLRDAWKRVDEASKQGGKDVTRLNGAISTAEAAEKARQLPEGDVASWRVKLDGLNAEIGRVREARGRADQAAKEARRQDTERVSLTTELDALNNTDHDALDQRAQAAIDEARVKAAAAATATQEARQRHEAAVATADQKQRELVEAQASAKLAPRFTAWNLPYAKQPL